MKRRNVICICLSVLLLLASFPTVFASEDGMQVRCVEGGLRCAKPGEEVTMTVEVTGALGDVTYRWYLGWAETPIPGADGASLTVTAGKEDADYQCEAQDTVDGKVYGVTVEFRIHVDDVSYIWSDDFATCAACVGDNAEPTEIAKATVREIPATCEATGLTVYSAGFNNKRFYGQIREIATPPLGHDWGEPTYEWTKDLSEVTARSVCGNDKEHVITETVPVRVDTLPPTCTEPGKEKRTAIFTNPLFTTQTEETDIPASGHSWDKGEITLAPTCSAAGTVLFRCTVKSCGATAEKELPADPDAHVFKVTVTEPTCIDGGYTTHACTLCRYGYSDGLTDPLGHDWGEWTLTVPAAQDVPGEEARVCGRCGETETRPAEWTPPQVMLGDVDGDKEITSADARFALRRAVDLETYAPGGREFLACDADRDNNVTSADARKILRAAVDLEDPSSWLKS